MPETLKVSVKHIGVEHFSARLCCDLAGMVVKHPFRDIPMGISLKGYL